MKKVLKNGCGRRIAEEELKLLRAFNKQNNQAIETVNEKSNQDTDNQRNSKKKAKKVLAAASRKNVAASAGAGTGVGAGSGARASAEINAGASAPREIREKPLEKLEPAKPEQAKPVLSPFKQKVAALARGGSSVEEIARATNERIHVIRWALGEVRRVTGDELVFRDSAPQEKPDETQYSERNRADALLFDPEADLKALASERAASARSAVPRDSSASRASASRVSTARDSAFSHSTGFGSEASRKNPALNAYFRERKARAFRRHHWFLKDLAARKQRRLTNQDVQFKKATQEFLTALSKGEYDAVSTQSERDDIQNAVRFTPDADAFRKRKAAASHVSFILRRLREKNAGKPQREWTPLAFKDFAAHRSSYNFVFEAAKGDYDGVLSENAKRFISGNVSIENLAEKIAATQKEKTEEGKAKNAGEGGAPAGSPRVLTPRQQWAERNNKWVAANIGNALLVRRKTAAAKRLNGLRYSLSKARSSRGKDAVLSYSDVSNEDHRFARKAARGLLDNVISEEDKQWILNSFSFPGPHGPPETGFAEDAAARQANRIRALGKGPFTLQQLRDNGLGQAARLAAALHRGDPRAKNVSPATAAAIKRLTKPPVFEERRRSPRSMRLTPEDHVRSLEDFAAETGLRANNAGLIERGWQRTSRFASDVWSGKQRVPPDIRRKIMDLSWFGGQGRHATPEDLKLNSALAARLRGRKRGRGN